jgi:large subunit ribosomal protein L18e
MKNKEQQELVKKLYELGISQKAPAWRRIAQELEKPTRNRRVVHVAKLDKLAKEGFTLIVPGKVLSTGKATKKLSVVAHQFSATAAEKIKYAGGSIITLEEFLGKKPSAKKIMIVG